MNLKKLMERAESEAHKEAIAKGLKYKGFGYWADASGNIVARSSGDELVPVPVRVVRKKRRHLRNNRVVPSTR